MTEYYFSVMSRGTKKENRSPLMNPKRIVRKEARILTFSRQFAIMIIIAIIFKLMINTLNRRI